MYKESLSVVTCCADNMIVCWKFVLVFLTAVSCQRLNVRNLHNFASQNPHQLERTVLNLESPYIATLLVSTNGATLNRHHNYQNVPVQFDEPQLDAAFVNYISKRPFLSRTIQDPSPDKVRLTFENALEIPYVADFLESEYLKGNLGNGEVNRLRANNVPVQPPGSNLVQELRRMPTKQPTAHIFEQTNSAQNLNQHRFINNANARNIAFGTSPNEQINARNTQITEQRVGTHKFTLVPRNMHAPPSTQSNLNSGAQNVETISRNNLQTHRFHQNQNIQQSKFVQHAPEFIQRTGAQSNERSQLLTGALEQNVKLSANFVNEHSIMPMAKRLPAVAFEPQSVKISQRPQRIRMRPLQQRTFGEEGFERSNAQSNNARFEQTFPRFDENAVNIKQNNPRFEPNQQNLVQSNIKFEPTIMQRISGFAKHNANPTTQNFEQSLVRSVQNAEILKQNNARLENNPANFHQIPQPRAPLTAQSFDNNNIRQVISPDQIIRTKSANMHHHISSQHIKPHVTPAPIITKRNFILVPRNNEQTNAETNLEQSRAENQRFESTVAFQQKQKPIAKFEPVMLPIEPQFQRNANNVVLQTERAPPGFIEIAQNAQSTEAPRTFSVPQNFEFTKSNRDFAMTASKNEAQFVPQSAQTFTNNGFVRNDANNNDKNYANFENILKQHMASLQQHFAREHVNVNSQNDEPMNINQKQDSITRVENFEVLNNGRNIQSQNKAQTQNFEQTLARFVQNGANFEQNANIKPNLKQHSTKLVQTFTPQSNEGQAPIKTVSQHFVQIPTVEETNVNVQQNSANFNQVLQQQGANLQPQTVNVNRALNPQAQNFQQNINLEQNSERMPTSITESHAAPIDVNFHELLNQHYRSLEQSFAPQVKSAGNAGAYNFKLVPQNDKQIVDVTFEPNLETVEQHNIAVQNKHEILGTFHFEKPTRFEPNQFGNQPTQTVAQFEKAAPQTFQEVAPQNHVVLQERRIPIGQNFAQVNSPAQMKTFQDKFSETFWSYKYFEPNQISTPNPPQAQKFVTIQQSSLAGDGSRTGETGQRANSKLKRGREEFILFQ